MKKLPKKPSTLIRHALKDLAAVMKMKGRYRVDMGTWHDPDIIEDKRGREREVCSVCFAGSVMARSLGMDPTAYVEPDHFSESTKGKLNALNNFRAGHIAAGLQDMGVPYEKRERAEARGLKEKMKVPSYLSGGGKKYAKFKKAMKKMADHLQKVGL